MPVSTDRNPTGSDLEAFLSSGPPRQVSDGLCKAAFHQSAPQTQALILGLFGLLSLPLVLFFFPWKGLEDWRLSRPGVPEVPGSIDTVTPTSISENHRRIFAYHFSYPGGAAATQTGVCYTTGLVWRAGSRVAVLFLPETPGVACPQGARLSRVGAVGAVTVLIPAIAAVVGVLAFRSRIRVKETLSFGRRVEARIVKVQKPSLLEGTRPIKVIHLEVGDTLLKVPCYRGNLKTFAKAKCASGETVTILQHPARPQAVLFPELF